MVKIQKKVDKLRVDGTDKVVEIQNLMDSIRDCTLTKGEESRLAKCKTELEAAKAVEAKNKDEVFQADYRCRELFERTL